MSAFGTKRTYLVPHMSLLGAKRTSGGALSHVFKADMTGPCGSDFARFNPCQSVRPETMQYWLQSLGEAMRRRDFITLVSGTAVCWPLAAHAQQPERMRRIGVLMSRRGRSGSAGSHRGILTAAAIGLDRWTQRTDRYRCIAAMPTAFANTRRNWSRLRLTSSTGASAVVASCCRRPERVPIVFAQVPDPVGAGFVESLARPGGNTTGFISSNTA